MILAIIPVTNNNSLFNTVIVAIYECGKLQKKSSGGQLIRFKQNPRLAKFVKILLKLATVNMIAV